jgi:hypothetical protein
MIISQFWLPMRWHEQYPSEEFEVMVSNLEDEQLLFRFRFVATQVGGLTDCTRWLREFVAPLSHWKGLGHLNALREWRREGRRYAISFDIRFDPGATYRTGLAVLERVVLRSGFEPEVIWPAGVLRGHWELSLPALPVRARGRIEAAQRDGPVRVLIAAYHRARRAENTLLRDDLQPLPLASGRAEHLIAPDPPRSPAAASGIGISPRSAARSARARGRKR